MLAGPQHRWPDGLAWMVALPTGVTRPRQSSASAVDHLAARDYVLQAAGVSPAEMSPALPGPAPDTVRRNLKSSKSAPKPRLWQIKWRKGENSNKNIDSRLQSSQASGWISDC